MRSPRIPVERWPGFAEPAPLEISCKSLITIMLREIGFVSYFFSLVERRAGLRSLPLQNSGCVKCLRRAMKDWLSTRPGKGITSVFAARVIQYKMILKGGSVSNTR